MITAAQAEAEQRIIGATLIAPGTFELVALSPEQFFQPRWRATWEAISAMRNEGGHIDPLTVAAKLEQMGRKAIDESALVDCTLTVATIDNAEFYADIIRDSYLRRSIMIASSEILELAKRGEQSSDELLSSAMHRFSQLESQDGSDNATPISQIVKDRLREIGEIFERQENGESAMTGIPTGIGELDSILGGIQRGIVTVCAARPGMGKSGLAQTITDNVSRLAAGGVHVFSLEDTRNAYADRAFARTSRISAERIRQMKMSRDDMRRLSGAADNLFRRRGWIVDDRSGITADEIVRSVRRNLKDNGTELVVVDYVQLVKPAPGFRKRHEQIDQMMTAFSNAAKQDNVAYLVLSQLNRSCESRDDKRPMLSDLKESGAIEERAKCVLFMYRDAYYNRGEDPGDLELIIAKNNHGQTGKARARWDGETTRVY